MGQTQGSFLSKQIQEICKENKLDFQIFYSQIQYLTQQKYQFLDYLGNGSFGSVIQAYSENYKNVAIKIIQNKNPNLENALKEAVGYKQFKNKKNLVEIYEIFSNPTLNTYFIVSELCDCSLKEILQNNTLNQKQIYEMTLQLLQGLVELESNHIFHGDIKQENILYSRPKNKFLYCDFGLMHILFNPNKLNTAPTNQIGRTLTYSAPEFIANLQEKSKISNKIDIYSLGVNLLEIVAAKQFSQEEANLLKNNDDISKYFPLDTPYKQFLDNILQNMVKVKQEERKESSQLIELLKQDFSFSEQDLLAIYVKQISKLLSNQQKLNQDYQIYYQKYFSLKNSQKISINESRTHLKDMQLLGIVDSIKLCKQIQDLELLFYVNQITDNGLFGVTTLINENQKYLQSLKLNFEENLIRDKGLLELTEAIKKCQKIKKLDLQFSRVQITDTGFKGVEALLQSNIELEDLKLYFSENQITGNGLIEVVTALSNQAKLKRLSLYFSDIYINDEEMQGVTEILKQYKQLSELKLSFSKNQLTSSGLQGVSEIFKDSYSLQVLELALQENQLDDIGLISIVEALKKCQILQQIECYFSQNKITDHGLIATAEALSKCQRLQDIHLDFSNNEVQEKQRIQQVFDSKYKGKINYFNLEL